MHSLWSDNDAASFSASDLALRVYSSRLLGRDPALVLHGGGNTSVKSTVPDFFGAPQDVLYIKGSGGDLATIGENGFAAVQMSVLLKMADLAALSDADMVREQRAAMLDPDSPNPSIEAVVHAVLPHKFVDHTHSNAVVAVTNQPDGEALVRATWGVRVIIVPYVMPGFLLGKAVRELTKNADWSQVEGLILMQHGIFTFGATAQESYERMIKLVSEAEAALEQRGGGPDAVQSATFCADNAALRKLAAHRQAVSKARGRACVALPDFTDTAAGFASRSDVASLATRGTLTPDHSIRTKRVPAILDSEDAVSKFAAAYAEYFQRNQSGQTMLDPAPRWAVLPGQGIVSFGASLTEARVVNDIAQHTLRTIQQAESAGGWVALPEKDLF